MSLKLADVRPILTMLTKADGHALSNRELGLVVAHAEKNGVSSATAAVQLGLVASSEVPFQLKNQCLERVNAAYDDIRMISKAGKQEQASWLEINWGGGKIYNNAKDATTTDGAVLVANIAQNLVLIANNHPELADEFEDSVAAAGTLVSGLAQLQSAAQLTKEKRKELWDKVLHGLRYLAQNPSEALRDNKFAMIDMEKFIAQSTAEVEAPHDRLLSALNVIANEEGNFTATPSKNDEKLQLSKVSVWGKKLFGF